MSSKTSQSISTCSFYGSGDSTPPKRTKFNNINEAITSTTTVTASFATPTTTKLTASSTCSHQSTSTITTVASSSALASLNTTSPFRPAFRALKDNLVKSVDHTQKLVKISAENLNKLTSLVQPAPEENGCDQQEQHQVSNESGYCSSNGSNNLTDTSSLDRDSPIPLKNLGNTCYENSIIQCLFSLELFMENFERSMEKMRCFVVDKNEEKSKSINIFSINKFQKENVCDSLSGSAKITPQKDANKPHNLNTITQNDVRFRIADAFQKLYHSYTSKRSLIARDINKTPDLTICHIENETGDTKSTTGLTNSDLRSNLNVDNSNIAPFSSDPDKTQDLIQSNQHSDSQASNFTPIALLSTNCSSEQSEIETRLEDLKSAVGERSSQFNSTHQQDASEFFYHVIDSIQEFYQCLNNDQDDPVKETFELELDYSITCPKCHHKTYSDPEKIRTLPLALPNLHEESSQENNRNNEQTSSLTPSMDMETNLTPLVNSDEQSHKNPSDEKENHLFGGNEDDSSSKVQSMSMSKLDLTDKEHHQKTYTLSDALNNYFKDDLLDYNCSQKSCESKQRTKKCWIRKLPQVLFITLARYSYTGKKNLDKIEAPFELSVPLKENKSPSHSPSAHQHITDDNNMYQLVAVVCHLGSSLNAGHYTSYVYNQNNDSWYSCDDDSITKVNEFDVQTDASKSGYCFFYAHKSSLHRKDVQECPPTMQSAKAISQVMMDSSTLITPISSPESKISSQNICDTLKDNHQTYDDDWC